MPAFSGLWDGVHNEAYADRPKAARQPLGRGIVRVLMQKRGMHGHVNALTRNAPATIARVVTDRSDVDVIGGMEAWPSRNPDAANKVTVANLGDELQGGTGTALDSVARVPDASADDLVNTYDTTKNSEYAGDDALNGVTAPPLAGVVET